MMKIVLASNNAGKLAELQIMLAPEELAALDDFRFKQRMPSRAAAVRELLKLGLAAVAGSVDTGMRSRDYGVFDRGTEGHRRDGGEGASE